MLKTAAPPEETPEEEFDFLATAEDDSQTVTALSGAALPFALLHEERHGVEDQPSTHLNPTMSGPFLNFTADFTSTNSTFFGFDKDEDIEFD